MTGRVIRALLLLSSFLLLAPSAAAQFVVVQGRVEDAVWRQPLAGVRVLSADSSAQVFTDSLGAFSLVVPSGGPFAVRAERLGYVSQRFELGENASSQLSVLLLEPAPIELEGVDVVTESALTEVLSDLRRRRNAYFGPVTAFDRAQLERFARFGSVWDFVRMRTFGIYECNSAMSGLCVRDRGRRSFRYGPLELPVRICIDGRESWGAVAELNSLDIGQVSLVEIYAHGRGGIQIYTPGYITASARTGRNIASPLEFGC